MKKIDVNALDLKDRVVAINRVTKVVKGGRTFRFAALVKDNSLKSTSNIEAAKAVGTAIAKRALEKGIDTIVFDRSGYIYHGKIKALADAAREAGLKF